MFGNKKNEINILSLDTLNQVSKSICKITINNDPKNIWAGTGFFMSIKYENKILLNCLLTNYHIITPHVIRCISDIIITIKDNKDIALNLKKKKRIIKYFEKPIDITLIEILNNEELYENIEFLSYDLNFLKYGFDYYLNKDVFLLQHPLAENMHISNGKILSLKGVEFEHNAITYKGSSGSPVILIENKRVIGIHKKKQNITGQNYGTFIGKFFNEMKIDSKLAKRINDINIENQSETPGNKSLINDNNKNNNQMETHRHGKILKYNKIETPKKERFIKDKNIINQKETPKNEGFTNNNQAETPKNEGFINNNNQTETPKNGSFIHDNNLNTTNSFDNKHYNIDSSIINQNNINVLLSNQSEKDNEKFGKDFQKSEKDKNIIILKYYKKENKNNIILFSKKFAKNYKNNFIMFINNQKYEVCYQLDTSKINIINSILEVKLKIVYELTNLEGMFEDSDLESISGFSALNAYNITNISYMFSNCLYLKTLSDFGRLNTSNVEKMNHLFYNCKSLESLPENISEWDTSKATHMNHMFSGCENLKSLPDISKWNTSSVIYMKHMFSKCKSLQFLPDISNWDLSNAENISHMFSSCESLKTLPDIQKWKIRNIKNISSLFSECKSLESIPDISKWKTNNIINMNGIFESCEKIKHLPDISKWKTGKVEKMSGISNKCKSLKSNPKICHWNKKHVNNKKNIFGKEFQIED